MEALRRWKYWKFLRSDAGPGQIRIRNYAAAVNPTDVAARNGLMAEYQKINPPPYVPGMDAAGIVDQLGEGVETDIKVGDEVMAMVVPSGSYGAYREQIVLDQNAVVRAPQGHFSCGGLYTSNEFS